MKFSSVGEDRYFIFEDCSNRAHLLFEEIEPLPDRKAIYDLFVYPDPNEGNTKINYKYDGKQVFIETTAPVTVITTEKL